MQKNPNFNYVLHHYAQEAAFDKTLSRAKSAVNIIETAYRQKTLPHWQLPESGDVAQIQSMAAPFRKECRDVLILGTGGSSLGGKTIYSICDTDLNLAETSPRLHFLDNIDPDTFDYVLSKLDAKKTGIIAISKSGSTAETLCQFFIAYDWRQKASSHAPILCITEPTPNSMREAAMKLGVALANHDPDLGGRFSVLSLVGLLPAAIGGADIAKLREGATACLKSILSDGTDLAKGSAITTYLYENHGININVMMPYIDRLKNFSAWHKQLWAESLGKNGKGITPVDALGAVDQHSQLQLFLDGPPDKFFTFIIQPQQGKGSAVPASLVNDSRLNYLTNRRMGDLLDAEQRATIETVKRKKLPLRIIELPALNEFMLGYLLLYFMAETVIAAELLGVNPFDQPAVEEGKILTRTYMQDIIAA